MLARCVLVAALISGCDAPGAGGEEDLAHPDSDGGTVACGTPAECEANAAAKYDGLINSPVELAAFLKGMPKGGDLHNHLSGAVYAETYLDWAGMDGDCINSTTYAAVFASQCSATNQATPTGGTFYDQIVRAWSMEGFMTGGAVSGHDHFFATFGKFGAVAGAHRDDTLADIAKRAADENQVYIETMFNLGKNVGTLAATVWTQPVTEATLPQFYDALIADAGFANALSNDVNVVNGAASGYKNVLGCSGATPHAACQVGVRFIAQVARTGALDNLFGQLVSAYEMAAKTPQIVGANLSSPEDDTTSLKNYDLHMAMLDFLYNKYTVTQKSPLHITLHAGELVPKFLPPAYSTANTFHVRHAVETGHAERIGHGVDILSETDPPGLMAEMKARGVLVEVCLASNDQILEVSGTNHPLGQLLQNGVPVALATDDQGVSRSSLAGEYVRAARDQKLSYRQLKTLARNSLEHAFLPGASLWISVLDAQPVADCAPIADSPSAGCQAFLTANERARTQWELERRFRAFESKL